MSTSNSIQNTLHLLLPTASNLPPQLTSLATSLLAQSRIKATSLKPEEEIARTYACCHIACERLKNKLGLELGKVSAPCGPRVYKRLYGFLGSALKDVGGNGLPGRRRGEGLERPDEGGGMGRTQRMNTGSPAVKSSGGAVRKVGEKATPSSLGKRTRGIGQRVESVEMPRFVIPLIRHLCKEMDTAEAATHVHAGVESVYRAALDEEVGEAVERTPSKRRKSNDPEHTAQMGGTMAIPTEEQMPALVAAVYFTVASEMYGPDDITDEGSMAGIKQATQSYFAKQKAPTSTLDLENFDADFESYFNSGRIDWPQMEWFQNLPRPEQGLDSDTRGGRDDDEDASITPRKALAKTPLRRKEKHAKRPLDAEEEEDLGAAGLLPGLGTMFQAAVDWLSDDRRAELDAWKRDMRRTISLAEQAA